MPDLILAHDIGTSGDKATLYSVDGDMLCSVSEPYQTSYGSGNRVEQNPQDWWDAVCSATRRVLEDADIDPERIGVVSFSGQMMGCVLVDNQGRVLRNALIWADQRSTRQVDWMLSRIPMDDGYNLTGHRMSPAYSLPKLLWVRDNEPEVFERTSKMLNPKDFIVLRMTGEMVTDESDASGTLLFDLHSRSWSDSILDATGLPGSVLPRVVPSPTVVGSVTSQAAELTGLRTGTPVVCGAGDGMCAGVGAGCVDEGSVYTTLGSSAWIASASRGVRPDPQMRTFTWAHAVPGLFSPCGTAQAAGASFDWALREVFAGQRDATGASGAGGYAEMNELAAQSPVGANGVLFLPYLMGERTPWWNPAASGSFLGLTIDHTRADLIRAVIEGIFLTMRLILDIFRPGITAETMVVTGGFARGAIQQRIMADVYGMPLAIAENLAEATSMGAAVIGGVGSGLLEDFSAVDRFHRVAHVVEPDKAAHERYTEVFELFSQSYNALEPVYDGLAAFRANGDL